MAEGGEGEDEIQFLRTVSKEIVGRCACVCASCSCPLVDACVCVRACVCQFTRKWRQHRESSHPIWTKVEVVVFFVCLHCHLFHSGCAPARVEEVLGKLPQVCTVHHLSTGLLMGGGDLNETVCRCKGKNDLIHSGAISQHMPPPLSHFPPCLLSPTSHT